MAQYGFVGKENTKLTRNIFWTYANDQFFTYPDREKMYNSPT